MLTVSFNDDLMSIYIYYLYHNYNLKYIFFFIKKKKKGTEYQLLNIDDGFLSLMTSDGSTKDDVRLPDGDIGTKIQEDFDEGDFNIYLFMLISYYKKMF
jgi:hypothetical protein